MGGIVNVVTKSGTNAVHGTTWYYGRNDAFDARNTCQPDVTPFKQHQYGASGGGPILKNRSSSTASYQGFRYRRPDQRYFRVPTSDNLNGDLSDEGPPDLRSIQHRTGPRKSGSVHAHPLPGQPHPCFPHQPGTLLYAQNTLPSPVATGLGDRNALDGTPVTQNQHEYSARVDHVAGPKDSLWFRYSATDLITARSGGRPALENTSTFLALNTGVSWGPYFWPVQLDAAAVRTQSVHSP